ncbi:MAG: hypothetical protein LBU64_06615, partial [Planctomycetota bacterium]|nr:hypothetical protein [Planctomycetota bacterium]
METQTFRRSSSIVRIRNLRLTSLFKPEDIVNPGKAGTIREIILRLLEHLALNYGIGNIGVAMDEVMASLERDDILVCPGLAVLYGRLE